MLIFTRLACCSRPVALHFSPQSRIMRSGGQIPFTDGSNMRWRPRIRFRLATLLVAITALCAWLGLVTHRARKQKEAIAVLSPLGAKIHFDFEDNGTGSVFRTSNTVPGPAWARRCLGDDYFRSVVSVSLASPSDPWKRPIIDRDLELLAAFSKLRYLNLTFTRITDDGMTLVARCRSLKRLDLAFTPITDDGLRHVGRLRGLVELKLSGTKITDDGLANLRRLSSLESLDVGATRIRGVGLRSLATLPRLRAVDLGMTALDREGVAALSALPRIQELLLADNLIDASDLRVVANLPALKRLVLENTQIDDRGLACLRDTATLTYLNVEITDTSAAAVAELQQALPRCKIDHSARRQVVHKR